MNSPLVDTILHHTEFTYGISFSPLLSGQVYYDDDDDAYYVCLCAQPMSYSAVFSTQIHCYFPILYTVSCWQVCLCVWGFQWGFQWGVCIIKLIPFVLMALVAMEKTGRESH